MPITHRSIPRHLPGLLLAIVVLTATCPAARAEWPAMYHFDEAQTPIPDLTRIVVFMEEDPSARASALDAAGLRAADREPLPMDGWWDLPVAASVNDRAGLEATLDAVLQTPGVRFASPVFFGDRGGIVIPTEHVLVQFDASVSAADAAEAIAKLDPAANPGKRNWARLEGAYRIDLSTRSGLVAAEIAARLAERDDTVFAEVDMIATGGRTLIPNDQYFGLSWGLHNTGQEGGTVDADMDVPEAWGVSLGDPSVVVAVLDTGVDPTHPDINQIPGYDTTTDAGGGAPVNACDNHGTAVAGCISSPANNSIGTCGVAPNTNIVSIRPFISNVPVDGCDGSWSFFFSWFVDALDIAETTGCRITNNSNYFGSTSSAIESKYLSTRSNGMIHFASAGNDGVGSVGYPASLPTVNAVAALDRFGNRASFSQWGPGLAFSAPGEQIASTDITGTAGYVSGDYVYVSGTSFASPYAAGVAALVLSTQPTLTVSEIETVLQNSCVDLGAPGFDTDFGWGFINAYNAIAPTVVGGVHVIVETVNSLPGPVSIYSTPDGGGMPLSAARTWSGTAGDPALVADATIRVRLLDDSGAPIVGFPAEDILVQSQSGGWSECPSARLTADAPTDAGGYTTISGPLYAGGASAPGELLQVIVLDAVLPTTYPGGLNGLTYSVNSSDMNDDKNVNLVDIGAFAQIFSNGYDYAADFTWDGAVNLVEVGTLSVAIGATCPDFGAKLAGDLPDRVPTEEISLVFANSGTAATALAPGQSVEAQLVLRGPAAREGVTAFDARVRGSENVVIEEISLTENAIDFADGQDLVVGLPHPMRSESAAVVLARLRISVRDGDPAYLWIEPSRISAHSVPTVASAGELFLASPVSEDVTAPVASINDVDGPSLRPRHLEVRIAPNPFNPRTEILCRVPATGPVEVKVIDVRGQLVTVLHDDVLDAGDHTFVWDGTDRTGAAVSSGVYFTAVRTSTGTQHEKMVLLK